MIKYYNLQKMFLLKNPFFMFLADFNFSISHLKKTPSCSFKHFKSSSCAQEGRKKFTGFGKKCPDCVLDEMFVEVP